MEINLIWAQNQDRVIGKDGAIPWHIPADLERFRALTMGYPIIMGRGTWESLPKKPLPGRMNIVVSKTIRGLPAGVWAADDLEAALDIVTPNEEVEQTFEKVFIIGGERLYEEALPLANKVHITHVITKGEVVGDRFAPALNQEHFVGKLLGGVLHDSSGSDNVLCYEFQTWTRFQDPQK